MRFTEFQQCIGELAGSASDAARRRFAIDNITRLHSSAMPALQAELTPSEFELAEKLSETFADGDAVTLAPILNALNDSMTADDVRAIEFHANITEWMCAIDHWINYLLTLKPQEIAALAMNMVNSVDYAIGGDVGGYSIENVLASPLMQAEHERQRKYLSSDQ